MRGRGLRLSTGICQREQELSHLFFAPQQRIRPPRPVGGVSIKHYLSWCGWRTLKKHPWSYITNSGRSWIYCTQRNTRLFCRFCCWLPSMFYCQPKQNGFLPEIRKMQDHSIFVLFQKFNQSSPRDNFCGAANRWQGLIRRPSGRAGLNQLAVQNHFAPRGRVSCPSKGCQVSH